MPYQNPELKLLSISKFKKQLWPVIYVNPDDLEKSLIHDLSIVAETGCDACVLELSKDPNTLSAAIYFATHHFKNLKIGVNYLGGIDDSYGYINSFAISKKYDLPIVWTDFAGVDLIRELPEISLHEIESHRNHNAFYCSGVHMKYGTLINSEKSIEQSALQALGWVDGVIITGEKTGQPADPKKVELAKSAIKNYPLGIASGVSAENLNTVAQNIDFFLVNSSIADQEHRLDFTKTKKLCDLIHSF